jgi:hypothetical protein
VGARIGVKGDDLSPWYSLSIDDAKTLGLYNIRVRYRSLYDMLHTAYPSYPWQPWRFHSLPGSVASDPEVIKAALDYAEGALGITAPEQWYSVSTTALQSLDLLKILAKRQPLYAILTKYRPSYPWKESAFDGVAFFGSRHLGAYLRELWPSLAIVSDHQLAPGSPYRVDYFVAALNIAFDYVTDRDCGLADAEGGKVRARLQGDAAKVGAFKAAGIALILIPFWWDRSLPSLQATVNAKRPDLGLTASAAPIPEETVVQLSTWRRRRALK